MTEKDPKTISFDDDEIADINTIANWWAGVCRAYNRPVPPDAYRALLDLGRVIHKHNAELIGEWLREQAEDATTH